MCSVYTLQILMKRERQQLDLSAYPYFESPVGGDASHSVFLCMSACDLLGDV